MKDPGVPETRHWQAASDRGDVPADVANRLYQRTVTAEAECERLRAALDAAEAALAAEPSHTSSDEFYARQAKFVIARARAALGEADDE